MSVSPSPNIPHLSQVSFIAGIWLVLCAEGIAPLPALLWTILAGVAIIYPAARFARTPHPEAAVYAVAAMCCLGGLAVLWALGAPKAALLLAVCGALGALLSMILAARGVRLPADAAWAVFVGGVLFMESWWGLPVLMWGAWLSRTRRRVEIAAIWALGLGLAWGVYVPVLSFWSLVGFFGSFAGWSKAWGTEGVFINMV
ncbi:MAG: hypothetical protein JXB47_03710 [Anaerolineae bacterium]|nr:hypothetical protein [Anaerolineae bacterium]